jgi:glutamate/tyrosine decarboxylase-like PLP-dependent enzyme
VLALLDEAGSPATVASAGGRYFGFVIGGSLPAALAANVLAAAWDQNTALRIMSPVAAELEDITLAWLRDLFQLPATAAGSFVTGATMANFTCLAAARNALLARSGWDVEALGLFGAPAFDVVVGEEAHASLRKALSLAGLGRDRVITVPADGQGRMRADSFPELTGPALICLQAGNVNTGAFDPADEICAIARKSQSWVHVDGAFGLWALCSPERAHLAHGFPDADSWATDAHKWLNVPYDSGLAFVRDANSLYRAMSLHAAYLHTGDEREPAHYTPESSRRARAVDIWAALRSLGRTGLAAMIERNCRQAARFAEGLRAAGHEILNDVVLNQVLVSFGADDRTRGIISAVQRDGACWCGGTTWHGRAAMRISVSSWATTDEDVERSLSAILRLAGE